MNAITYLDLLILLVNILDINLKNLSEGVYSEFKKRSTDNKIDSRDLSVIINIASKDGINTDEANFIKSITDQKNVDKLNKSSKVLTKIDLDGNSENSAGFIKAFNSLDSKSKSDFLDIMNMTETRQIMPPLDIKELANLNRAKPDGTFVYKPFMSNLNEPIKDIKPKEPPKFEKNDVLSAKEKNILEKILVNGVLTKKDLDGNSVLENLKTISQSKKVDGNKVLKEMINILNPSDIKENLKLSEKVSSASDVGKMDENRSIDKKNKIYQKGVEPTGGLKEITQCPTHYTCGAASMEVFLKDENPESLVKMVKDLATSGESKFRDKTLKNPPGALNFHAGYDISGKGQEDRTDADIILQSAIMQKVSLGFGDYNIEKDTDGITTKIAGNGGGNPKHMSHMMENITGKKFNYEHNLDFYGASTVYGIGSPVNNDKLFKLLDDTVSNGKKVIIAYNTNPNDKLGLHYVTVLGKNDKGEYCFVDTDQKKEVGSKLFTMNAEEMKKKISVIIYPEN